MQVELKKMLTALSSLLPEASVLMKELAVMREKGGVKNFFLLHFLFKMEIMYWGGEPTPESLCLAESCRFCFANL